MKTCTVWGDMSADRASENYPTVAVCDDCVEHQKSLKEDNGIVTVGDYQRSSGEECHFCEKTLKEEQEEQGKKP